MKGRNQFLIGLKGSVENMTVVQAPDGDAIVKGKIVEMTNPNSEKQQVQRARFLTALAIAQAGKVAFRTLLKIPGTLNRGFSRAMGNMLNAFDFSTSGKISGFRAKLNLAQGPLPRVPVTEIIVDGAGLGEGVDVEVSSTTAPISIAGISGLVGTDELRFFSVIPETGVSNDQLIGALSTSPKLEVARVINPGETLVGQFYIRRPSTLEVSGGLLAIVAQNSGDIPEPERLLDQP